MHIENNMNYDELERAGLEIERRKNQLIAQQRPIDLAECLKLISRHKFTSEELNIKVEVESARKGKTLPIKFYARVGEEDFTWAGQGTRHRFFQGKNIEDFSILSKDAKSIALKLKRNVKPCDGEVVSYLDVLTEVGSNQESNFNHSSFE